MCNIEFMPPNEKQGISLCFREIFKITFSPALVGILCAFWAANFGKAVHMYVPRFEGFSRPGCSAPTRLRGSVEEREHVYLYTYACGMRSIHVYMSVHVCQCVCVTCGMGPSQVRICCDEIQSATPHLLW